VFHFAVKSGNAGAALARPGTVLLAEKTATRLFGAENPVGKNLKLAGILNLEVAGVIADSPGNSHLPFSMLVSYPSLTSDFVGGLQLDDWGINSNGYAYMRLPSQFSLAQFQERLHALANKYVNNTDQASHTRYLLQPVADIHFNKKYADSNPTSTLSGEYLYWLAAIGFFLLAIACINYINLSTAFGMRRSMEVGVRKSMGAQRGQLAAQFLTETFLLTTAVVVLAGFTLQFWLPMLNNFLGSEVPLHWLNGQNLAFLAGICITTALLSGVYPAVVLAGYSPAKAIKGKVAMASRASLQLRRGLVVFQFSIAQIFIAGVLVVAMQMDYVRSRPLGFQKEHVLDIPLPESKPAQLTSLRSKLGEIPGVQSLSFSLGAPTSNNGFGTDFNLSERFSTEKLNVEAKLVDRFYLETYGLKMLSGRYFDENDEKQVQETVPEEARRYNVVLNETAVKKLGFATPEAAIGQKVKLGLNEIEAPVIGVVKDFHISSLHESVEPVLLIQFPYFTFNAGLKLATNTSAENLASIQKAWESVYPERLYESTFLDEHLAGLYQADERSYGLIRLFSLLALFINALGLIGLVSFVVEQKRKEIGVRKVLGASAAGITGLLSVEFLKLVLIAIVLASPLAYYFMQQWLGDFAYRISLHWWMFALAGLAAVTVALLTLSFQTVRAAMANPVKALRSE
jgi:ABC-type antimicrobial peptide transport system permease subunit